MDNRIMLLKRSNWLGLVLLPLLGAPPLALSLEHDSGPLPPPKGPYFSSKPLLYSGEEVTVDSPAGSASDEGIVDSIPVTGMGGAYPVYSAPAPFAFAPEWPPYRPIQPSPQGSGPGPGYPRYQGYPAYQGYPGYGYPAGQQYYPPNRGYPPVPPFQNRGGR